MIDDCTLIMNTYDDGEDLWEGFFTALQVQWPELDMPIIMNTHSKTYSFPGYDIKTLQLYKDRKTRFIQRIIDDKSFTGSSSNIASWSERLIKTLKRVSTDYVLLFVDDFWLDGRVDDERFLRSLQWLRDNPDIATFSYAPCRFAPGNIDDQIFEDFELRPQSCEYKFNGQIAIWRRKRLLEFLRPHESIWDFEIYGSMRASRYHDRFYVMKPDAKPIFPYYHRGMLIRGKWVEDKVRPLQEKDHLKIDHAIRGFYEENTDSPVEKLSLLAKFMKPHRTRRIARKFVNKYRRWLSLR